MDTFKQYVAVTDNNEVIGNQSFLSDLECQIFAEHNYNGNFRVLEYVG